MTNVLRFLFAFALCFEAQGAANIREVWLVAGTSRYFEFSQPIIKTHAEEAKVLEARRFLKGGKSLLIQAKSAGKTKLTVTVDRTEEPVDFMVTVFPKDDPDAVRDFIREDRENGLDVQEVQINVDEKKEFELKTTVGSIFANQNLVVEYRRVTKRGRTSTNTLQLSGMKPGFTDILVHDMEDRPITKFFVTVTPAPKRQTASKDGHGGAEATKEKKPTAPGKH